MSQTPLTSFIIKSIEYQPYVELEKHSEFEKMGHYERYNKFIGTNTLEDGSQKEIGRYVYERRGDIIYKAEIIRENVKQRYEDSLKNFKPILDDLIGKRATFKDLPISTWSKFDKLQGHEQDLKQNKTFFDLDIAENGGYQEGGFIINKLMTFARVFVEDVVFVCRECHQVVPQGV